MRSIVPSTEMKRFVVSIKWMSAMCQMSQMLEQINSYFWCTLQACASRLLLVILGNDTKQLIYELDNFIFVNSLVHD